MNSFLCWIGGKKQLRKEIIKRFPAQKSKKYVEVFGGAGWVLFGKEVIPKQLEVLNDCNSELITLYRCAKYHPEELQKECQYLINSREIFSDFKQQLNTKGLTDIQRSARFLYILKISYGADLSSYGRYSKSLHTSIDMLLKVSERLKKVVIENMNYDNLILSYDSEDTLFYLDPPYFGSEKYYSSQFTKEDHIKLAKLLRQIKGKFILSYNDDPFIRDLYSDFHIEEIARTNNLNHRSFYELIIRNYT